MATERSAGQRRARRTRSRCGCNTDVDPAVVGRIATAIAAEGGIVTALDVAESRHDRLVVDVTCSATDSEHADEIVAKVKDLDGRDRAQGLRPHLPAAHRRQDRGAPPRSRCAPATTCRWPTHPGVGRVSLALAEHPEDVPRLTVKGNSVAVVTDGSAVLGLGNIGPGAALPVMEGKCALFKRFAGHRRLADLPRHPGHRPHRRRGRGDRARLRRHQPRGHRRPALLRDRAAAA